MKTLFIVEQTHSDPTRIGDLCPLQLVGMQAWESSAYILGDSYTANTGSL